MKRANRGVSPGETNSHPRLLEDIPTYGPSGSQHKLDLNSQRPNWLETPGPLHCNSALTHWALDAPYLGRWCKSGDFTMHSFGKQIFWGKTLVPPSVFLADSVLWCFFENSLVLFSYLIGDFQVYFNWETEVTIVVGRKVEWKGQS